MVVSLITLQEDYWDSFQLSSEDIDFLYNYLLEVETPLTSQELMKELVEDRIRREKLAIEARRKAGGDMYLPKLTFKVGQKLVFPALGWRRGEIIASRPGKNPDQDGFEVVKIAFDEGDTREFATGVEDHPLNNPPEITESESMLHSDNVMRVFGDGLMASLEEGLSQSDGFVRIAARWFPKALLVDINIGQLNLAEALLDMEGGGPASTSKLLDVIDMPGDVNQKLAEFSLDFSLWQDKRFDEVGPAGQILWFLHRLEPPEVLETPEYLRYIPQEYDRGLLTGEMLELEHQLDDELSPLPKVEQPLDKVEIQLLYPHWRVGSLPLSSRMESLFPTAYQAPRIRFILVDGETGKKFPGWVVRKDKYVFGLRKFYEEKGLLPGSRIYVERGTHPGEVIIHPQTRRPVREWIRTVLVGSDANIVLAMLKQIVSSHFDDRTAIAIPDPNAIDAIWKRIQRERTPFEKTVVNTLRELTKLNPQSHVHASELYATVNLVRRCPPGPILTLLGSRPWFDYVGDLYFRFNDYDGA